MSASARVCRVRWARVDDAGPAADGLLGEDDLARRSRLAREDDRRRLTASAALLRLVLAPVVGCPPAALRVDRTCERCRAQHGRPRLPGRRDVAFSLTHSGGWVGLAVVAGAPPGADVGVAVGLDVEDDAPLALAELDDLAAVVLAPPERADLAGLAPSARPHAFRRTWVRKEALVKATGHGLGAALEQLVLAPPSAPPRVLRWDVPPSSSSSSSSPSSAVLHDLRGPGGCAAALALVPAGWSPAPERAVRDVAVVEEDAGAMLRAASAAPGS